LDVRRNSERLDAGIKMVRASPDFTADLGFVPRTDFTTFTGSLRPHVLAATTTWYTGFHPLAEVEETYGYGEGVRAGRLTDNSWRLGLELRLPRGTYVGTGYRRVFTYFDGAGFPGQGRLELWGGSSRFQAVRADVFLRTGGNVLFEEQVAGRFWAVELTSDLRFSEQFDGALSFNAEVDRRSDDQSRYAEVVIPRLRLSYQFTKELAVRTIGEWNSERRWDRGGAFVSRTRILSLDGLASYVLRPGTVVFLGYGSRLAGPEAPALIVDRNNVFVKLSYLWQD
jgi:hypothetical protein